MQSNGVFVDRAARLQIEMVRVPKQFTWPKPKKSQLST